MAPLTILYVIAIMGVGAAFAIYTTYKQNNQSQYKNYHSNADGNRRKRKSRSYFCNRRSDDCIICLTSMEEEKLAKIKCGHLFHKECLTTWLNRKKECPICRAKIRSM